MAAKGGAGKGKGGGKGERPGWARLLPELLAPAGYRSYHSGKWHVDGEPLRQGFDRSLQIEGGQNDYFDPDGITVDEQDYRYTGPRPTTKETAIVMLADAVEALSRLVNTQQREDIEKAVDQIVIDRMTDGQLSEAPLTLGDIDTIKASFVKTLIGSSHQRVRYKDIPEETDQSNA